MPVARHLRHLYRTESWRELVAFLRRRSGNRCEWCGKPNGGQIWTRTGGGRMFWRPRGRDITWRDQNGMVVSPYSPDSEVAGKLRLREIRVVCCGAHLNHQAGDDRPENAALLCQWCHLMQDKEHHRDTRRGHKDMRRPLIRLAAEASA